MRSLSIYCMVLPLALTSFAQDITVRDFALAKYKDAWLRHPVYGDASFDTFTHAAANPIHRGSEPYEWPVNGYLFEDPQSQDWFLYVGHYRTGYQRDDNYPSRATVFRSSDQGKSWDDLGPVFPNERHVFDGEESPTWNSPDVSVTYVDGRYHLSFDWSTRNSSWSNAANPPAAVNSGAGYAWAERPEGPYHRTQRPIVTTRGQPLLQEKYRRVYASTIIRRATDWIVLTLTDSGPNFGWAYLGMTSESPEGPYTSPKLLLHPEAERFHPPLMEFHPAFVHDGYVYAPATSVALNRDFQMVWRAPLENALEPEAWEIFQHGSVWHAEPVEHEYYGIWGQTFSGFVDSDGIFRVMFPSRDEKGMGTINTASRPWNTPYRERGFVVSGHAGPSFVRVNRAGPVQRLEAALDVSGTVTLVWNAFGPVGPDRPSSDATLHPLMLSQYAGLELTPRTWALVQVDVDANRRVIAEGPIEKSERIEIAITWSSSGAAMLLLNDSEVYSGALTQGEGALGVIAETHSQVYVDRFVVTGELKPAHTIYLHTEAILGAAQDMADWEEVEDERFRYGVGVVSRTPNASVKWNVQGAGFTIHAPRGPEYGSAIVIVDGKNVGQVDFHDSKQHASKPLFTLNGLEGMFHSISLHITEGVMPVDVFEVSATNTD